MAAPTIAAAMILGFGTAAGAESHQRPPMPAWDAPAGCPTTDEVEGKLPEPTGLRFPIGATDRVIMTHGSTWRAALTLAVCRTRTNCRFKAGSCSAVASAAAQIIALAADDTSKPLSGAPAPPPPSETAPPPAAPVSTPPGISEPTVGFRRDSQLVVAANGVVDWHTMPSGPANGVEIGIGRSSKSGPWRPRWMAGADFFPMAYPPPNQFIGGISGSFWMVGLSGRGCFEAVVSRLEIGPCLGGELVAMHASAVPFVGSNTPPSVADQTSYWFSFLGSISASWNISRMVDIFVRADVVLPTKHPTFGIQFNVLDDYHLPDLALRGALGVALRFD